MVEPALHFAVPFVSFRAAGIEWRKSFLASMLALAPDLDVLLNVHRSMSHSILILGLIALPILVLTWRRRALRNLVILCVIGVISHFTLDLFSGYTPILWPLLNQSFWISASLDVEMKSPPTLIGSIKLLVEPTRFTPFQSFQAPLITPSGVGVFLFLLVPLLVSALVRYPLTIRNRHK